MENLNLDQYNQKIVTWASQTTTQLKRSIGSLSMKGKGVLMRSLFAKTKKDFGAIESIVYTFNRYGVFFHKGVGRGYTMAGGRVIRGYRPDSKILRNRKDKTQIAGQGGSINRDPKEWFNPVLDREVPKLADMVGQLQADMAAAATVKVIK